MKNEKTFLTPNIDIKKMNAVLNKVQMKVKKKDWRNPKILKSIFGLIDLTSLEGSDTQEKISFLCQQAINVSKNFKDCPNVAAICVYPNYANLVKKKLTQTNIHTAVVAGGFPSGQTFTSIKIKEAKEAIKSGADEIDLVINRGFVLEKNYKALSDEITSVKEAMKGKGKLKVILETGELESLENIRIASDIAIASGADFIKTSTGKIKQGASLEAVYVMLEAIKDNFQRTGKKIGIKPSGGISSCEVAYGYYLLVKEIVGEEWLNLELMRFGASSLAGKILGELYGEKNLNYFKSDFSY